MFKTVKSPLTFIFALLGAVAAPLAGQDEVEEKPAEPADVAVSPTDAEALKVATVDVQLVFRQFYKTKLAELQISQKRALIAGESRAESGDYKRLDDLVKELNQAGGEEKTPGSEKEKLESEFRALQEDFRLKAQERNITVKQQNQLLDRQMSLRMESLLNEVKTAAANYAEANGFDLVLDTSGLSTAQAPLLIYAENALNITATILKELNKDAPLP